MNEKLTKDDCIKLICSKFSDLKRLPVKADFTEYEVMIIKSYFGPWPRALEEAGLRASKSSERINHNREKRARTMIRIATAIKESSKNL